MFGVSLPELIVILAVALIVFGPDKLPEVASQIGKIMRDIKSASDGARREFYNAVYKPAEEGRRYITRELTGIQGNPPATAGEPKNPAAPGDDNPAAPAASEPGDKSL